MSRRHAAPPTAPTAATRRDFLRGALGAGAGLGLASVASSCASTPAAAAGGCAPVDATAPDAGQGTAAHVDSASDAAAAPCLPQLDLSGVADGTLDVAGAKLPYRQDDPAWGSDLMWDRALVIEADTKLNGDTKANAEALLRAFDDGNNLANEGCMLTCLAMVLRLLEPLAKPPWTPKNLNKTAQELYYYTPCGLSMTTLFADLVSEVTSGTVQLCLKEEYLPGEPGWPKLRANTSALVRAYRRLPPQKRSNFLVMLKTGTYDDTVASHYVLLHPGDDSPVDNPDPEILDPAKPLAETKAWHLSDSAKAITQDPDIAAAWKAAKIEPTQIGGAWVFARWQAAQGRALLTPLISAWALELADPQP